MTGQLISQPTPNWSSSIGSNLSFYFSDQPKVKFDNLGDLVVCGNIMTGNNGLNMLLIKYTASGSLIWLKTYNGLNNKDDELSDFVFDNQNNIYVTGKSSGAVTNVWMTYLGAFTVNSGSVNATLNVTSTVGAVGSPYALYLPGAITGANGTNMNFRANGVINQTGAISMVANTSGSVATLTYNSIAFLLVITSHETYSNHSYAQRRNTFGTLHQ